MSLLKDMIEETAAAGAVSAHSIATTPGSLFGGGSIDPAKAKKRQRRKMRKMMRFPVKESQELMLELLGASSGETDFSPSDVISKLDHNEKKAKAGEDTTAFGLEDEEGNLVKVYVKTDSAEDFEHALASMLAGEDENEDDENSALEIAEVLFNLKDKFEIVDVEWPEIEGDEEEEQEMDAGAEGDMEGGEGDLGLDDEGGEEDLGLDDESGEGEDLEGGEGDLEGEGADETDAKSALDKVIDMMKADAEAKQAEAKAKEAEAKAKEAEFAAKAAEAKVNAEEQILDMEAYYKDKQEQEKEAKQLAKLAKFRHDQARDAQATLESKNEECNDREPWRTNDEEEEDKELNKDELATLIYRHLQSN